MKIELVIRGIGHVPSFKNSKMLTRGKLITDPKKQKWMNKATRNLESQLRYFIPIQEIGTETGLTLLSKIASFMPLDDSLKWIPKHNVDSQRVSKGYEGANITIERIA